MEIAMALKATELRLGLPGTDDECVFPGKNNKRASPETAEVNISNGSKGISVKSGETESTSPAPKAQIVGWPPVKSYRKNNVQAKKSENEWGMFVKVSVDGAPFLRKIDLKLYTGYAELLEALEAMFKLTIGEYSEREGYKGSEYAPAYEDKDGDLMLVGDVPWEMFMSSCKRLRIMRGAEARGLGCASL
ncbi:Auxin-responsive protein IAA4 [Striga hermonthica]|uniref:Auxin-responsive protein n=1 Tax=Striga hermonthica TaxID=68872 RepID=A0A9N7ND67_STRHE|nr:Auxin-responsive protein IAA4 [Striga hermonthica]